MPATHTPEQTDLIAAMQAHTGRPCGFGALVRTSALAKAGDDVAANLMTQWKFWERYERSLASGRHEAAQAIAMMVYDVSKAA